MTGMRDLLRFPSDLSILPTPLPLTSHAIVAACAN